MNNKTNTPVIIGAGIAGLSAANHLVDHAIFPIIIEADVIGRNKICGEFFSPEAIPFLQHWNIPLIIINKCNFITKKNKYSFVIPPAASVSHAFCELELSKRAVNFGAQLLTKTCVTQITSAKTKHDSHYLTLSTGQTIETNNLIIATGKLQLFSNKTSNIAGVPEYVGIKAHFTNINMPNELYIYLALGAYMGVTYIDIDNSIVNICCLAKKSLVDKYKSVDDFFENFITSNNILSNQYNSSLVNNSYVTGTISKFGKKIIPDWHNTYFIGDAAATIYPASGNGLTMGLTAGVMAADYIINNMHNNFRKKWGLRYNRRLQYAHLLHKLFLNPSFANTGFKFATLFPSIFNNFYKRIRD